MYQGVQQKVQPWLLRGAAVVVSVILYSSLSPKYSDEECCWCSSDCAVILYIAKSASLSAAATTAWWQYVLKFSAVHTWYVSPSPWTVTTSWWASGGWGSGQTYNQSVTDKQHLHWQFMQGGHSYPRRLQYIQMNQHTWMPQSRTRWKWRGCRWGRRRCCSPPSAPAGHTGSWRSVQ